MKILLSAFACAPARGSEPGVGWNWAICLARQGHNVTVLTQERNRSAITAWLEYNNEPRLEFVYVSLFKDGNIPGGTLGHYIYYYLWQVCAACIVFKNGFYKQFELLHHLTYGGIRTGSLLCLFPKPFMFGPVGGGETCPLRLIYPFGYKALMIEATRKLLNALNRIEPIFMLMQLRSTRILAKTSETQSLILPIFRNKSRVLIEIGAPTVPIVSMKSPSDRVRILFAGRLMYWKGADIVADAALLLDSPQYALELTFVGKGKRQPSIVRKLEKLQNISSRILGHVEQSELFSIYAESDIFVFPSLHDSSGNVVLEAMAFGLPAICLNLGGPPLLVGSAGRVIPVEGLSYVQTCTAVAGAIRELVENKQLRKDLSLKARRRAADLTWDQAVNSAYFELLEHP